jgi:hypothetical protein
LLPLFLGVIIMTVGIYKIVDVFYKWPDRWPDRER